MCDCVGKTIGSYGHQHLEMVYGVRPPQGPAVAAYGPQLAMPYLGSPVGYPAAFYGRYSGGSPKPGDIASYYPQLYITHAHPTAFPVNQKEGEYVQVGYTQHPSYPSTFISPYSQPYSQYFAPSQHAAIQVSHSSAHPTYSGPYTRLPANGAGVPFGPNKGWGGHYNACSIGK